MTSGCRNGVKKGKKSFLRLPNPRGRMATSWSWGHLSVPSRPALKVWRYIFNRANCNRDSRGRCSKMRTKAKPRVSFADQLATSVPCVPSKSCTCKTSATYNELNPVVVNLGAITEQRTCTNSTMCSLCRDILSTRSSRELT